MPMFLSSKRNILLAAVLLLSLNTHATRRYVTTHSQGNGSGNSWDNSMGDLEYAISLSNPGDEIWVGLGTYKTNTSALRNESFYLKEGVKMYGGFFGVETSPAERAYNVYRTILSGDVDSTGSFDSYHVVQQESALVPLTDATVLDGFTITGGQADYRDLSPTQLPQYSGAGLFIWSNSSPVIANCRFENNYAEFGAAICIYHRNNNNSLSGGHPVIQNCSFEGNAINRSNPIGGNSGISFLQCNLTLRNDHFVSDVQADYILVTPIDQGGDGLIYNLDMDGCTMVVKWSLDWMIGVNNVNANITNSVFLSTTPSRSIGAELSFGGNVNTNFSYCTFWNMRSMDVSGTVAANTLSLKNSIIWGRPFTMNVHSPVTYDISHNIAADLRWCSTGDCPHDPYFNVPCNNCPGGNGNVNPLFVNENDPDGPDNILGTADDGLRLSPYSPAIDAGDDKANKGYAADILGAPFVPPVEIGSYQGGVCTGNVASRLYVNPAVAGGDGTGSSWQNAIPDLRTAIGVASLCTSVHEIWVAGGTYRSSSVNDKAQYFYLRENLALYGGFAGTETLLSQRNWTKNSTILTGDVNNDGIGDATNILYNRFINNTAIIDGFTITGGYSDSTDGAGIKNSTADPVIRNCVVKGNYAGGFGGGMYNGNSSPTVINTAFFRNASLKGGGAVFNAPYSNPEMRNCVFASNTTADNGGAVYNLLNTTSNKLINCTLFNNSSALGSGGVFNSYANPTIVNSILWKNNGASQVVNGANGSAVVSYSHIQNGYTPCTNCTDYTISPKFMDSSTVTGPNGESVLEGLDGVFGTIDDGLQLQYQSPCIDKGNNAAVTETLDITQDLRIDNGVVNLGAYETLAVTSLQTGDWQNASTWSIGATPNATHRLIIKPGHTVTISAGYAAVCKAIAVLSGGQLVIPLLSSLTMIK